MPTAPNPTFYLGLTLAGAGSAGCYTGGVMDYLFEILDLWEKAKNKNLSGFEEWYDKVPQHNVMIDAMGGASAGGMTAMMSAIYVLNGKINPVKDASITGGKRDNVFYDSWVNLADDPDDKGEKTLAKALKTNDLNKSKFLSALNSDFIDEVANKAFGVEGNIKERVAALPSYFSDDMDLLLSHTMLRGIPLSISFSNHIEAKGVRGIDHNTFEHFIVSQYRLNKGEKPSSKFLWLNPYEKPYSDIMVLTTKATGAFPIGLRFREIDEQVFSEDYIKAVTKRILNNRFGQTENIKDPDWSNFPVPFEFVTIDGGAINNEPFGEVLGILKYLHQECYENGYAKYGIVMVDPFPDIVEKKDAYKSPKDLFSVVPATITTLHEQSKVKRADIVEESQNPYFRGEIFPRRSISETVVEDNPIASGTAYAFSGFLDINFRHYDFFLGRDNAKNFFRYYFSFEYKKDESNPAANIIHPIHRNWTEEMIEMFKQTNIDGKTYLPIIPDMNLLRDKMSGINRPKWDYAVKQRPVFDPESLFALRIPMEDRFERILDIVKKHMVTKSKANENSETARWLDKYYHKSWRSKLVGIFWRDILYLGYSIAKSGLARKATEMVFKWIFTDLEKKGFLKKME